MDNSNCFYLLRREKRKKKNEKIKILEQLLKVLIQILAIELLQLRINLFSKEMFNKDYIESFFIKFKH